MSPRKHVGVSANGSAKSFLCFNDCGMISRYRSCKIYTTTGMCLSIKEHLCMHDILLVSLGQIAVCQVVKVFGGLQYCHIRIVHSET